MVNDIANILKTKLTPLTFIDRLAGLVRVQTTTSESGAVVRFPVSCDISFADCNNVNSTYKDLIPNSSAKCIVYFEDFGITPSTPVITTNLGFTARFKLVGWINQKKIGSDLCSASSLVVANIIKQLDVNQFNQGMYQFIEIVFIGQDAKHNTNPFSKYSYDENVNQYLMKPYDYFSLNFDVNFDLNTACLNDLIINTEIPC